MRLGCQRGQGLVETALAAPLLVLLSLGLLQVGQLCWLRVKLQAAAQAAARAYTVWQPDPSGVAILKARRAAWLAMRPQPRGSRVLVRAVQRPLRSAEYSDRQDLWLSGGLTHRLALELQLPSPIGLGWLWSQGITLTASADILSEESKARRAADE